MTTSPIVQFKKDLDAVVARELDMIDDDMRKRMRSVAVTAVSKDPELLMADRQSFMAEIRRAANYGILPDGVQATLQVYNTKVKVDGKETWVKKVTLLPMIRGIIERVMRSGKIKIFYAEVVYEGEAFTIDQTQGDRRPKHEFNPMQRGTDDQIIGAYSVATYLDGTVDTEPMPMTEIMKVRQVAKTKNVWDNWKSEKCKVAVMKRHSKRLPLSDRDLEFITNREETDFEQARDVTPEPTKRTNLAQQMAAAQQIENTPDVPLDPSVDDKEPALIEGTATEAHWTDEIDTAEAFPGDELFGEGAKAFQSGAPRTDCPHSDHEMAKQWLGGWDQARNFNQQQQEVQS